MPVAYNPTPIDFSSLANLGTIPERLRMRDLRNQFSSGAFDLPNGGYDYRKAWNAIGGVDPVAAAKGMALNQGDGLDVAKFLETSRHNRALEAARGQPTAADRKAVREAKLDVARTEEALATLREAYGLIGEKGDGIYDQYGAELRADIGTNIPIASEWLGKEGYVDSDKAMRTQKYRQLMGPEALKYLSTVLKGPTSEKEMAKFMEIYNKASTPNPVKAEMLETLIKAGEHDLRVQQGIVSEDSVSAPTSNDKWTPGEVYPTPMGNKRYLGNDEWEDE